MATVQVLCGAARSERAAAVDTLLRTHWGRALLVVPTRAYARERLEQALLASDLPGAWGRPVRAFAGFVADLLEAHGVAAATISDVERRLVLEQALARRQQTPAVAALGPVAATSGFAAHMLHVIAALKQAAVEPEAFRTRAADRPSPAPLDAAVAEVYAAYQEVLQEAGVYNVQGFIGRPSCRVGGSAPPYLPTLTCSCWTGSTTSRRRSFAWSRPSNRTSSGWSWA